MELSNKNHKKTSKICERSTKFHEPGRRGADIIIGQSSEKPRALRLFTKGLEVYTKKKKDREEWTLYLVHIPIHHVTSVSYLVTDYFLIPWDQKAWRSITGSPHFAKSARVSMRFSCQNSNSALPANLDKMASGMCILHNNGGHTAI